MVPFPQLVGANAAGNSVLFVDHDPTVAVHTMLKTFGATTFVTGPGQFSAQGSPQEFVHTVVITCCPLLLISDTDALVVDPRQKLVAETTKFVRITVPPEQFVVVEDTEQPLGTQGSGGGVPKLRPGISARARTIAKTQRDAF